MFWIALGLLASDRKAPAVSTAVSPAVSMGPRRLLRLVLGAVCVTILAGAFVAGTRVRLIYNHFPLTAGRTSPADYVTLLSILQNTRSERCGIGRTGGPQ